MHLRAFALMGVLATAPAVAAPKSFLSWFDSREKAEKPTVQYRDKVDLDGDGQDDDVVCYFFQPESPVVLVGLATGEGFALSGDEPWGPGGLRDCPEPPSQSREAGRPPSLRLKFNGMGYVSNLSLQFNKQGPLLLKSDSSDRHHDSNVDLVSQRRSFQRIESDESSTQASQEVLHAALVASGTEAPSPPAPTWVSWGKERWTGPEDADLKVHVMRRGDTLTVVARLTDDQHVPAADASPRAILAADHLELWWSKPGEKTRLPIQLGMARTAEGSVVAAWFQKPGRKAAPLPVVRWTSPEQVEVDLPLAQVVHGPLEDFAPEVDSGALTVVFSDSDGKGQETLVSTTRQRPSGTSFSSLYVAEPGSRFPSLRKGGLWTLIKPRDTLQGFVR
jgi:hypothetical protein